MFYARLSHKGEATIIFNQLYAESMMARGNKQPPITHMNYPIYERESILIANQLFHPSQPRIIPENADVALLSSKHNACPCIIGINKNRKVAFLWHISYSNFEI